MTLISTSIAIAIVVLAITLVLAASGRVQSLQGSRGWLTGALVATLIAAVALYTLTDRLATQGVSSEAELQRFITSLPAPARGTDAEETRARIEGLVAEDSADRQVDCEALVGQNAEFARTLELLRADIRRAAEIADTQQATIEQLKAENRRLQGDLGAQ